MSTYYSYYIGYKKPGDNKINGLLNFDKGGKVQSVLCHSSSFELGLCDLMRQCDKENLSEEFGSDFDYHNVYWLPYDELPSGDFVKKGYYLVKDVNAFLQMSEDEKYDALRWGELFIDHYETDAYIGLLQSNPKEAKKYMQFSYVDYNSINYDTSYLRRLLIECRDYSLSKEWDNAVIVCIVG